MNLQRLRYFRTAAEYMSLRKAAEALDLSQPTLSRQIQILEHELKAPLFLRTHKRLTLTEAGVILLSRAGQILDSVDEVQSDINRLTQVRKSHVSVGAIQSTLDHVLPRAIIAFRSRYPSMHVSVQGNRSAEIAERVGRRALDIGIVAAPVTDPRLSLAALARDPFLLVVPRGHRLAGRPVCELASLGGEPFITFPGGFPIRDAIDQATRQANVEPRIVIELESIEAIKQLVRESAGVSLLPRTTLLGERCRGDLALVRIAAPQLERQIFAIQHVADAPTAPACFLRDSVRAILSDLDRPAVKVLETI